MSPSTDDKRYCPDHEKCLYRIEQIEKNETCSRSDHVDIWHGINTKMTTKIATWIMGGIGSAILLFTGLLWQQMLDINKSIRMVEISVVSLTEKINSMGTLCENNKQHIRDLEKMELRRRSHESESNGGSNGVRHGQ